MIKSLNGTLIESSPTNITLDVGGVGYEVFIPLSSYDKLPPLESPCKILIHMHVREDTMKLFGFVTQEEKQIFRLLIGISGIGPKMALSILSGMNPNDLKTAIATNNDALLSKIPGVGKKTAQRLIVELKERMPGVTIHSSIHLPKGEEHIFNDAIGALINLGYKPFPAKTAIEKALAEAKGQIKLEPLLKNALKYL